MPKLNRRSMSIRGEAELNNIRERIEKQDGLIEYLSMMTDVEIPGDEEEGGEDE